MKIGILTFHYVTNYGAVLQAYATQTFLAKRGIDTQIINYVPSQHEAKYLPREIEKNCFCNFRNSPAKSIAKWLRYKILFEKEHLEKIEKFNDFNAKQLELTPKIRNADEVNALSDNFSAIICGSDQVWNPEITFGYDLVYFGGFLSKYIKKISYAASVGDTDVLSSKENIEQFFELIKNFDSISVREQTLANFIYNNSEVRPTVTLDPTLLLDSSDYDKITAQTSYIDGDYLLIYQLSPNLLAAQVAQKIAKERKLKIVEICGGMYYVKGRSKSAVYNAGPPDFLGLFKNAAYIVTTSFHGTAFSIIYRKDFNTILNKKRNSRIVDLLSTLKLQHRIITDQNNVYSTQPIDYSKPLSILADKRAQSIDFLISAIST